MKIPSWLTSENIKKVMDSMNKGIKVFNNSVQNFGDSMSKMDRELSNDVRRSQEHQKIESNKNQKNVEKLFGPKKSIW